MSKKRILVLGTYPVLNPLHGGQKRIAALLSCYAEEASALQYVGIINPTAYRPEEVSKRDIFVTNETAKKIFDEPIFEDILLGESIWTDLAVRSYIEQKIRRFKPDTIILEHPYAYMGLRQLLEHLKLSIALIYSSHNVESHLKKEVYRINKVEKPVAADYIKRLENAEKDLSKKAKMVIAVTENDAEYFTKIGAQKVVIAPNGSDIKAGTELAKKKWKNIFKYKGVTQVILFTGSAHSPNLNGFEKMVGTRLGYIPFNQKIVIVGSVAEIMDISLKQKHKHLAGCFWVRAHNAGRLPDEELAALIDMSSLIIVPITEGGGSNLKTAEAILSGKNVLATSMSFRGYEEFKNMTNVHIEDDPDQFKKKIVKLAGQSPANRSLSEKKMVSQLTWQGRLKNLKAEIGKV